MSCINSCAYPTKVYSFGGLLAPFDSKISSEIAVLVSEVFIQRTHITRLLIARSPTKILQLIINIHHMTLHCMLSYKKYKHK